LEPTPQKIDFEKSLNILATSVQACHGVEGRAEVEEVKVGAVEAEKEEVDS